MIGEDLAGWVRATTRPDSEGEIEIICPVDGSVNPGFDIICGNCEQNFARVPEWLESRFSKQLFVNGLRFGAVLTALALAITKVAYPLYTFVFLLTFLLLAFVLREYPVADARTRLLGFIVYGAVGLTWFSDLVSPGILLAAVLPFALVAMFIAFSTVYRRFGRLGYYPFFPATVVALLGAVVIRATVLLVGIDTFDTLLEWIIRLLLGTLLSGIVVGGIIAGVTKTLGYLAPTAVVPQRISRWRPATPMRRRGPYPPHPTLRSQVKTVEQMSYLTARSFHALVVRLVNGAISSINGVVRHAVATWNVAVTVFRRSARRLYHIGVEAVLVVRDGLDATLYTLNPYLRRFGIPLLSLAIAAAATAHFADLVSDYVFTGRAADLLLLAASLVIVLAALVCLVAAQTGGAPLDVVQALTGGLVGPSVGALGFFILMSFGLTALTSILHPNPYRIGPVTVAAVLVVIGGVAYGLLQARGASSDEPVTVAPSGRVVELFSPLVYGAGLLVVLGIISLLRPL